MTKRNRKSTPAPQGGETPTPPKAPTKKQRVLDMLNAGPVKAADIALALDVTPVAAKALIGDVRRMGHTVTLDNAVYTIQT